MHLPMLLAALAPTARPPTLHPHPDHGAPHEIPQPPQLLDQRLALLLQSLPLPVGEHDHDLLYIRSTCPLSSFHLLGLGISREIRQLPRWRGIRGTGGRQAPPRSSSARPDRESPRSGSAARPRGPASGPGAPEGPRDPRPRGSPARPPR